MKAVLQRVTNASVTVDGEIVGEIRGGLAVLLGVDAGDTEKEADFLAEKIYNLRIFSDSNGKMNLSLKDICGEILVVSNFTLCGDCSHGRRPFFGNAAAPDDAKALYLYFCDRLKEIGIKNVKCGIFGADMKLSLLNDGPVTVILDTKQI